MKPIFSSISWRVWSTLTVFLLLALLLLSLILVNTDDPYQPVSEAANFQGGWTAWLDPVTGELSKEKPPEGLVLYLDDQAMRRFSTSDVDLISETLEDGTVFIDLKGRFQQGSVATIDGAGEVQIHRIGGEMFTSPDGREISRSLHEKAKTSDDSEQ